MLSQENIQTHCEKVLLYINSVCQFLSLLYVFVCVPLPCVCVSGSLFRGLRSLLSGFFPPVLLTPPPDPTDPSDGVCDLLLNQKKKLQQCLMLIMKVCDIHFYQLGPGFFKLVRRTEKNAQRIAGLQ